MELQLFDALQVLGCFSDRCALGGAGLPQLDYLDATAFVVLLRHGADILSNVGEERFDVLFLAIAGCKFSRYPPWLHLPRQ